MPFKTNASRSHRIPKQRHRIRNWAEYDAGLRARGSLTVWFTPEAVERWRAETRTTPGGQQTYSDLAITAALTLRAVFRLPLRQTEGLVGSIVQLLGMELAIPDHSTLSRRAKVVRLPVVPAFSVGAVELLVGSTGVKLCRSGEWLVAKHGTQRRRAWKKLHVGLDAATGRILAAIVTDHDVDDASQVGPLLAQIEEPLAAFVADGAYDQTGVTEAVAAHTPDAAVVVPPRSMAVPSANAATNPTQRDRHLQHIAEHGRMAWQKSSRYSVRARVEAFFSRWKRVIGDALRFRTEDRRNTEIAIAIRVLNHMLDLGRPDSVRVA
ncbi:IS5 family transposase [Roseomonas genomospecies 6]|uniref:IS5 family transposase n=1 Tax=Roseomonas genomospecies 6 TaxID=214106 RepID=A0A9W7NGM7_9PROT|nr:IS5 family transposase [Roseomonas genomospecies 6]KAA0676954.1 IS5 family transposase [Roseomonas genomospecies 6]